MAKNRFYCMRYYVTFRCNSRCSYCNVWQEKSFRDIRELPLEKAKELIRQCREIGVRYIDFTGGEPTLYRQLPELIRYAKQLGIKTEVTTNGLNRNDEQTDELIRSVDKLNLSLDTLDREKYQRIRGVDGLDTVQAKLGGFAECRRANGMRPPKMMVSVSDENESELEQLLNTAGRHQTEVYLNPVFPYFSEQQGQHMQRYIQHIQQQIHRPYAIVLLHFLEFYRDGGSASGVPCSANWQTITIAPDGSVMMPCYHAVSEWIPWDRPMEEIVKSPAFEQYLIGKPASQCESCTVSPYFGISFNYWLDKYFLLQSYSEKLHHLKEKYLNNIPELSYDTQVLKEKLDLLLSIVRSLEQHPRQAGSGMYQAEQYGSGYRSPIYRALLSEEQYVADLAAEDCWALSNVPHRHFDEVIQSVYPRAYASYLNGERKEEAVELFQGAMEFQLRWWCYHISRNMNVRSTCDLQSEQFWLENYEKRFAAW